MRETGAEISPGHRYWAETGLNLEHGEGGKNTEAQGAISVHGLARPYGPWAGPSVLLLTARDKSFHRGDAVQAFVCVGRRALMCACFFYGVY